MKNKINILSGILIFLSLISLYNYLSKTNNINSASSNLVAYAETTTIPRITETTTTTESTTTSTTTRKTTTTSTTTKKTTTKNITTTTNNIIVGNISISNSNFKQNLVQDDGSYYYLNHNINGVKDGMGIPMIDYRTNISSSTKTIIYGHSITNTKGTFSYLQNYYYKGLPFYKNHQYIIINYQGKKYTYQIFSVYVSTATSKEDESLEYYYNTKYVNSKYYKEALDKYKSNSIYDTGVSVNSNDKILILQTCSTDPKYQNYYRYNLLIMSKLISVE